MKLLLAAGVLAGTLPAAALGASWHTDIKCRPADADLVFDCTIHIADAKTHAPVTNAQFTVGADMPTMPMAHNVRPATAVAGPNPGDYHARLELEMYGVWALKLNVSSPTQKQIRRDVEFVDSR